MDPPPLPKSPSKLALITPSASPPPSKSFFPQPYRLSEPAPASKRQRLSSAPRQFTPRASSSSNPQDQIDFHKEREASTFRLLDAWSQLAERYTRRLDEDDIVDLRTGCIVKDNGVMHNFRKLKFGSITEPDAPGSEGGTRENDDEEDEEDVEDEDEDDVDELDAFADPGAEEDFEGVAIEVRRVPPVTPSNPADADDLREFMEVERLRKEQLGSESEDDSDFYAEEGHMDEAEADLDAGHRSDWSATELHEEERQEEGEGLDTDITEPPHYVDSGSDDELDNWDIDEASIVYSVLKKEEGKEEDSDSDIEIIEHITLHPLPSPPEAPLLERHLKPSSYDYSISKSSPLRPSTALHLQLQTPPQSYSSSMPSADTPIDDYFVDLPPESSSPPPPSSPGPSNYESSPTKPKPHPRGHPRKSLSSSPPSTPLLPLDLTKVSKPPNKTVAKSTSKEGAVVETVESSPTKNKTTSKSLLKPVVEIEKRPPFILSKRGTSLALRMDEPESSKSRGSTSGSTRAKGKEKENNMALEEEHRYSPLRDDSAPRDFSAGQDSDDPLTILSSPPSRMGSSSSKKRKTEESPSKKSASKPFPTLMHRSSPSDAEAGGQSDHSSTDDDLPRPPPKSPTGRKRKRVISSSELETPEVEVVPVVPTAKTSKLKADHTKTTKTLPRQKKSEPEPQPEASGSGSHHRDKGEHRETSKLPTSRSKSQQQHSDSEDSDSDSDHSEEYEDEQKYQRSHSHFGSVPPYAYPQPPYTLHHPHHQPPSHMFAPIPDPRAQFIITQAMHQLSALVAGGPWTSPQGMPRTPSRRHPHRGESMYSTPMHHPHPYQYMYDPDFSRATMPPESPEVLSSLAQPRERRKSLVRRSRSRGRRVSFRLEEGGMEWGREEGREEETGAIDVYSSPLSVGQERVKKEKGKARADDSPSKSSKKQDKGEEDKDKERRGLASGRHSPSPFPPRRARPATRGQTPGPTIHQEPLASVEESRTQKKKTPSGKRPRRKQSIGTIVSGNG